MWCGSVKPHRTAPNRQMKQTHRKKTFVDYSTYLRTGRGPRVVPVGRQVLSTQNPATSPVLHRPQKNVISPIFCTNLRLEAPLPVYFSCTTFRRSATTLATLLIPKCTTRRWTLRCSNYSVANRQQFSCRLSTATLSLKFENVVPDGWIRLFPFYI